MSTNDPTSRPAMAEFEKVLVRSDTKVVEFDDERPLPSCACSARCTPADRHARHRAAAWAVLFFSAVVGERFLDPFNLSLIVQQVTIIGILGIAQTLVMLTAGIDLSVGAIMVLCSVVMGKLAVERGRAGPARRSPSGFARRRALRLRSTACSSPACGCRPSS